MPTSLPSATTGRRLTSWRSIRLTASAMEAVGAIALTGTVITSSTRRPWARTYSSAILPELVSHSSSQERLRSVFSSLRRRKSPSLTMPTSAPLASTTGRPLILLSSIRFAASATEQDAGTVIGGEVMMA